MRPAGRIPMRISIRRSILFPEDPLGPDELLDVVRPTWPYRQDFPVHWVHPTVARHLIKPQQ
jgi:hypothetical protein